MYSLELLQLVLLIIGLFRADSYSKLIDEALAEFETDIEEVDFSSVPMIDLDSTKMLATVRLENLRI